MELIPIFLSFMGVVLVVALGINLYCGQQKQREDQQKSLEKLGNIPDCVKWVADIVDRGNSSSFSSIKHRALSYRATRSFLTSSRWSLCWSRERCARAPAFMGGLRFELPKAFRFVLVVLAVQAKAMTSCALLTKER